MAPGAAAYSAPRSICLVVQGIEERGVLGECDGVISGYLGSPDTGEAVVELGGAGEGCKSRRALLLRSGDRGRQPGGVRAPRHSRIHQGAHASHRRRRHAQSVRTRSVPSGPAEREHGRSGCGHRCGPCLRAARGARDLGAYRRYARRLSRPRGIRRVRIAAGCARLCCPSSKMAQAMPSPPCFSRITSAPASRPKPCRWPDRRSSASSTAPPKPAPARCCWSKLRTNW